MTRSESARTNGAKSHGPKTPEGKQASAQNALRHGLTAKTMVLPGESAEEFEAIIAEHLAYYQPVGPTETALVKELAGTQWRQTRIWGYETGMLQKRIDLDVDDVALRWGDVPDHERGAIAFDCLVKVNQSFPQFMRYDASLRRGFHKALETLLALQKLRRDKEGPGNQSVSPGPGNKNCETNPSRRDNDNAPRHRAAGRRRHRTP